MDFSELAEGAQVKVCDRRTGATYSGTAKWLIRLDGKVVRFTLAGVGVGHGGLGTAFDIISRTQFDLIEVRT